jgi:hypothetical protein
MWHARREVLVVGALLAAAVVWTTGIWASVLRLRLLALLVIVSFAAIVGARRHLLRAGSRAAVASAVFLASLGFALYHGWTRPADAGFAAAQAMVTVLFGWAAILLLAVRSPSATSDGAAPAAGPPAASRAGSRRFAVWGLAAATFVALAVCTRLADNWFGIDEVVAVLQARLFSELATVWRWDGVPGSFFVLPITIPVGDGVIPHFPPGYPAVLAAFTWLGVRSYTGAVLGAAAVVFTYLLGRAVHSNRAGIIAAALLATQSWFLLYGSAYLSHLATMVPLCAAAWLLVRSEARAADGRRPLVWLAGLLMGSAVTVRPLTGLTLSASIWLWILVRRRRTPKETAALTGALALGALAPVLVLLYYNWLTTGSPWLLGYMAANGEWATLGFGERGYLQFDEHAQPTPFLIDFTPGMAAAHLLDTAWSLATWTLPLFTLVPLLVAAHLHGYSFRWRSIGAFLALPLAHFFYYGNGVRYHLELFPFVFVGVAAIIVHLSERRTAALRPLVVFLVCAAAVAATARIANRYTQGRDGYTGTGFAYMQRVADARREHGRILVFVRDPARTEPLFTALSWFNAIDFPGDIIVARDLGPANASLIERFPGHVPLLASWPDRDEPPDVRRLARLCGTDATSVACDLLPAASGVRAAAALRAGAAARVGVCVVASRPGPALCFGGGA